MSVFQLQISHGCDKMAIRYTFSELHNEHPGVGRRSSEEEAEET